MKRLDWAQYRAPEFALIDPMTTIAILPTAAVEQHGPHLPVGVDMMIADGMVAQLRSITREGHVLTRETIAVPMRNKYNDANLIYFCSGDELEFSYMNKAPDAMKVMKVLRRLYFDIGAGVPEFHE